MDRPETISLLRKAHDEIVRLRRETAELAPKAHAYDTVSILARQSKIRVERDYGEDVAWRLEDAINNLIAEREAEKRADSPTTEEPAA